MASLEGWQEAPDRSASAGFRAYPLATRLTAADWSQLSGESQEEPPLALRTFAELWAQQAAQQRVDPWQVLVESAAALSPAITAAVADGTALAPLRALLGRAEQAAVVVGHDRSWTSPDQWGLLLYVRHAQRAGAYESVFLHPPASADDLTRTEHVLATALPPSYRRFLLLANGLGLGESEHSYICGAGPTRAKWNAVLLNQWLECGRQHEVAAFWREFAGTYAYERIMDRERGEDTFRSDETALIPFAYTYETWCFDRTRLDRAGEYPIVLWDHELREATDRYADFDSWFAGEVEPYLFGDA